MSKTFNIHVNQRYAKHVVNLFFFNNNVYVFSKKKGKFDHLQKRHVKIVL